MVITDEFKRFLKSHPACQAYTQTFKDPLEKYKPLTQLKKVVSVFDILHSCGEFIVCIEFTNKNRIHLHGLIEIKNWHYYRNKAYKLLDAWGMFRIKDMDKPEVWIDYVVKEQEQVVKVFKNKISQTLTHETYSQIYEIGKPRLKEIIFDMNEIKEQEPVVKEELKWRLYDEAVQKPLEKDSYIKAEDLDYEDGHLTTCKCIACI